MQHYRRLVPFAFDRYIMITLLPRILRLAALFALLCIGGSLGGGNLQIGLAEHPRGAHGLGAQSHAR